MSRKSPFQSSQFGKSLEQSRAEERIPKPAAESLFTGDSHLQGIPTTDKKMRSREWEKGHKTQSYWGIPIELRSAVSNVAADIGVKVDDIARAFFEFSLEEFQQGRLSLEAKINPHGRGLMTLYPESSGWGQKAAWKRETWNPRPRQLTRKSKSSRKRGEAEKLETCVFTIRRLPQDLHQSLCEVADQNSVPVGQITIAFLQRGLEAYLAGELVPDPAPSVSKKTLFPEGV